MKKLIRNILVVGIVIGVFALAGVSEDINVQIKYSIFWLCELILCGYGLNKLEPKRK